MSGDKEGVAMGCRRPLDGFEIGVIAAFVVLLCARLVTACAGAAPSPVQQADVASYGGQQALCVAQAKTRAEADSCRDVVKRYWCGDGGVLREAGACGSVKLSDGGAP